MSFGLSRLRFETEAAFELVRARPPPYAPNPPPCEGGPFFAVRCSSGCLNYTYVLCALNQAAEK